MAAKLGEMYYITRLNKAFRCDLFWWHAFSQSWNGPTNILQHLLSYHTQIFVLKQMLLGHGVVQQYWDLGGYSGMATRMV